MRPAEKREDPAPSTCPDCGGRVEGGRAGCRAVFDGLGAAAAEGAYRCALHRLVVDAYSLQHPDSFCASAKSLAAHLAGMCCGLEHAGNPALYRAIQQWLNGPSTLRKPEVPAFRGAVTIADIGGPRVSAEFESKVLAWARAAWEAWGGHHALARHWVGLAMERCRL